MTHLFFFNKKINKFVGTQIANNLLATPKRKLLNTLFDKQLQSTFQLNVQLDLKLPGHLEISCQSKATKNKY